MNKIGSFFSRITQKPLDTQPQAAQTTETKPSFKTPVQQEAYTKEASSAVRSAYIGGAMANITPADASNEASPADKLAQKVIADLSSLETDDEIKEKADKDAQEISGYLLNLNKDDKQKGFENQFEINSKAKQTVLDKTQDPDKAELYFTTLNDRLQFAKGIELTYKKPDFMQDDTKAQNPTDDYDLEEDYTEEDLKEMSEIRVGYTIIGALDKANEAQSDEEVETFAQNHATEFLESLDTFTDTESKEEISREFKAIDKAKEQLKEEAQRLSNPLRKYDDETVRKAAIFLDKYKESLEEQTN